MPVQPILMFDFDGVIVDGISEYWTSSRNAFLAIIEEENHTYDLPLEVPQTFRELRPWVKYGWEMVLIAAEIARSNSSLSTFGSKHFTNNYHIN